MIGGAVLEHLGLTRDEEMIYDALLGHPRASTGELAALVKLDCERVDKAAERLEAGGLVVHAGDDPSRLIPVPPQQAFEPALLERERLLHVARAYVQELTVKWQQAPDGTDATAVSPVHGRNACLELWREAHASARCQVRGLERPPYLLPQTEPNPVEVDLLARRVPHRVVYDSAVIALPGRFDELKAGILDGEKARVHPAVPLRALLIDDRMALLPTHTAHRLSDGLFIVRPCALLDALDALFELLWEQAVPLRFDKAFNAAGRPDERTVGKQAGLNDHRLDGSDNHGLDHLILKLMAAGLSDAKIARQLGLSERTLQRRMAGTMRHLGAKTRLQAGVQAARKGWV